MEEKTIEESFCDLEPGAEKLRKVTKAAVAEARRVTRAIESGDFKALKASMDKIRAASGDIDRISRDLTAAAPECWNTVSDRLTSGYFEEVRQKIVSTGGEALLHEGQMLSYPSIVRVNTDQRRVTIDGRAWKSMRPSALATELLRRQRRSSKFKSGAFLEALYKVYSSIVRRDEHSLISSDPAPLVQLVDIYELMTAFPGMQRDYQRIDFARDLYRLDTSGTTTTRKGKRMRLQGSTGTKDRSRRLTFIATEGREITYYGIRFEDPA